MSVSTSVSGPSPGKRSTAFKSLLTNARYPLQISIAVVFTLLITVLGTTLVLYNYSKNKTITLLAATDLFDRITRQTVTNIRKLYVPAEILVDATAQLEATEGESLAKRLRLLKYFSESLHNNPNLASIYIGYEDSEFFLVRAIRGNQEVRQSMGAPQDAYFAVQSIELREDGQAQQQFLYYDEKLSLLGTSNILDTNYDPRSRVWYKSAIGVNRQIASGLYIFFTTRELGTTIARRSPNGKGVIAADLTLSDLSVGIAKERVTLSTEIVVFNAAGKVLAYPDVNRITRPIENAEGTAFFERVNVSDLNNPVLDALYTRYLSGVRQGALNFSAVNRDWMGSLSALPVRGGEDVYLAIISPQDELLTNIDRVRTQSLVISLVLLLVAIAIGWWIARRISASLQALAVGAKQIREFKLDTPIGVHSRVLEVDNLASTMTVMQSAIQQFVEISKALSAEKDFDRLLEMIMVQARAVCGADCGSICLMSEHERALEFVLVHNKRSSTKTNGISNKEWPFDALPLYEPDGTTRSATVQAQAACTGRAVVVDDIDADTGFDFTNVRQRYEQRGYRCRSILNLPLQNRQGDVIGVLELVNARDDAGQVAAFRPEIVSYVSAISSEAAIALDNRRLLKAQKELLDSFIQLIAGAIDAKSPYTSGHCQRVPELARMLAEAAQESHAEPFKDFALSQEEWYELHIASWLHDCGKVTTPEYVVDKATKLECIYNRIHEIRMRFEVLWRDAEVAYYRALAAGGRDEAVLKQQLNERLQQIQDDFAFVAECNIGGEFIAEERLQRLRKIALQRWRRQLDDRCGLSDDELARKLHSPQPTLPVEEFLLADKAEHVVPRDDAGKPFGDNPHGFRMEIPHHEFNFGEIYNLSIPRGTLTEEERFKINEHIIQTIIMLNKLPFPKELRRVPTWAGNHHEKLDGTGYPRRITAADLSIPERIMAIADIFEALTAADRPYKNAKPLSESIRIMSFMRNEGHICPELFDLFLTSGIYRRYAEQFLLPEQVDKVDISQFISSRN